uniref:Uncharacterized protein n=1 Tax=Anguilla anguilla TaxID=7936 RepID=A0A0E9UUU1_ANGAN
MQTLHRKAQAGFEPRTFLL